MFRFHIQLHHFNILTILMTYGLNQSLCISRASAHIYTHEFHTGLSNGRLAELQSVYFPYVESNTSFDFLSTILWPRIVPISCAVNGLFVYSRVQKSPGYVFDEVLVTLIVVIACFTLPRAVRMSVALRKTFPLN